MSERTVIGWDCPVGKKGSITIPKKLLEGLGNPAVVRLEYNGKLVVLKCGQGTDEAKQNATVQKEE